jgi:hypothetical protein
MLGGGDEAHKFMGRPRLDRVDFANMMNPGSRQIYLTFPADSTFREEDVSNYFRYAFTHTHADVMLQSLLPYYVRLVG